MAPATIHVPLVSTRLFNNTAHMLFIKKDPYLGLYAVATADTAQEAMAEILTRKPDLVLDYFVSMEEVQMYALKNDITEFTLIK